MRAEPLGRLLVGAAAMRVQEMMSKLKLDQEELQRRRIYFQITDEDLARLASLKPFAERHHAEVIEAFYRFILGNEESRAFFPDDATLRRVKQMQSEYFMGLFSGVVDLRYVQDRLRVGAAHERIGMPSKLYLGAYSVYLRLLDEHLRRELTAPGEALAAYLSLQRLVFFDMALAIDTYIAASLETLARHQAAIRELSTPVISVHPGVLLLPLVGTIDTQRAEQIMQSVLLRVTEEQARAVIFDIAGVAVVDTQVADHLLMTTAAVRLLGAETIITGVSAHVARTMVQLGVDLSTIRTRNRLADGIELALAILGKRIAAQEK